MDRWMARKLVVVLVVALAGCGSTELTEEHDRALLKGSPFNYQVQPLVESDAPVTYSASLADGRPLPTWLRFDAATRTFSGVAPSDEPALVSNPLRVQVVATGAAGVFAKTSYELRVIESPSAVPRILNPEEELAGFAPDGLLRWSAVAGADAYEVWAYEDAGLTRLAEFSKALDSRQYQFTQLAGGRTYHVKLYYRVSGSWRELPVFSLGTATTVTKARLVNSQEELEAFATDGLLRWSPVTGATAYELWIFTNPNASEIHESSGSLKERAYRVRTLQPGRTYYAQAYALVNGQWQVGSPVRVTTTGQPTRARLTTPQEQLESFPAGGTLRWTEVPGATAYELWIYGNAGLGVVIESGANADRSYQPRRLCGGGVYYVQVHALVGGQWTVGWATRLDVPAGQGAADCVPPAPQVKLSASPVEVPFGGTVTLSWSSQFATSCTASGAWSGPKALGGQETIGPINRNSLFSLSCTGPSGTYKAETLATLAGAAMVWDQSRWDEAKWQ